MKYWQEAASLILAMRPRNLRSSLGVMPASVKSHGSEEVKQGSSTSSEDYRVMMMKRTQSSSFMPSRYVFPGGVLQKVDHSKGWSDLFQKIWNGSSLDEFSRSLHVNSSRPPIISSERRNWDVVADVAFRICALRETFEESGLLFVTRDLPVQQQHDLTLEDRGSMLEDFGPGVLKVWRQKVNDNSTEFLRMCHELEVFPNVWILENWRNWLTPTFEKVETASLKPKRFDTLFYICCLDCEDLPEALVDETEVTQVEWKSPTEYLSHFQTSENRSMAPPQIYELGKLMEFINLDHLHDFSRTHGSEGMKCWMPIFKMCTDGLMIILPGDHLYPEEPDFEGKNEVTNEATMRTLDEQINSGHGKKLHRILSKDPTFKASQVLCNV